MGKHHRLDIRSSYVICVEYQQLGCRVVGLLVFLFFYLEIEEIR